MSALFTVRPRGYGVFGAAVTALSALSVVCLLSFSLHCECGLLSKPSSNFNSVSEVARCTFRSSDEKSKFQFTAFYVPKQDRNMYEEGLKEYLKLVGKHTPVNISVVCMDVPQVGADLTCQLCVYNEISADQKHARQGHVFSAPIATCMAGAFDTSGAAKMTNSKYYPICYPSYSQNQNLACGLNAQNGTNNGFSCGNKGESKSMSEITQAVEKRDFSGVHPSLDLAADDQELFGDMKDGGVLTVSQVSEDQDGNIITNEDYYVLDKSQFNKKDAESGDFAVEMPAAVELPTVATAADRAANFQTFGVPSEISNANSVFTGLISYLNQNDFAAVDGGSELAVDRQVEKAALQNSGKLQTISEHLILPEDFDFDLIE